MIIDSVGNIREFILEFNIYMYTLYITYYYHAVEINVGTH